ncbi:MAG: AraC family transcriptional regulator [Clostridiales bacterium]|nr:AraC family transcriptional regulator [Clostridiales bacterium]
MPDLPIKATSNSKPQAQEGRLKMIRTPQKRDFLPCKEQGAGSHAFRKADVFSDAEARLFGKEKAIFTRCHVFDGIELFDISISGTFSVELEAMPDTIAASWCSEGRLECEFQHSKHHCAGNGSFSLFNLSRPPKRLNFPLKSYKGIVVFFDMAKASQSLQKLSEDLGFHAVNLNLIRENLCSGPFRSMHASETVERIFSEIRKAPELIKEGCIRLKILELLLFLSLNEISLEESQCRYFNKMYIEAVKEMREHMASNLNKRFTLKELSDMFKIPFTSLKNCFKCVYGAPIDTYMREYRMQAAAVMLRDTKWGIAEIAEKVGYDSHAKFSAAFRASTGFTPSGYRKAQV